MKKTLFSFVVLSLFVISSFAKAQNMGQPMFQQQQPFQRMPMMMDAQTAQMQMMGGGMPPGFVGQVPGSYSDASCLNGSMMMPQAPITPAYYDQQQKFMTNH